MLNFCVHITTDTLVLIRLHKKADLLDMQVNGTKDRKVRVENNWERMEAIHPVA